MIKHRDLNEAADVWHVAHSIFIDSQSGKAGGGNGNGGIGDSKHQLIWVADVRKLVEPEGHVNAMDKRYGCRSENLEFTREAERVCTDILRKFAFELYDKPSVIEDYKKIRGALFG